MSIVSDFYIKSMKFKIDNMELSDKTKEAFKILVEDLDTNDKVDIFEYAMHISTRNFLNNLKSKEVE